MFVCVFVCVCVFIAREIDGRGYMVLITVIIIIITKLLSGAPSTGIGQTHSPYTMQSSSTIITWKGNLGRLRESEGFFSQMVTKQNYAI